MAQQIPVLVIGIFDLLNTFDEVEGIENLLKNAANSKISLVPVIMEQVNEVYYRDKNLRTYKGIEYTGITDDRRAIRSFIGSAFEWIKPVLAGREKIYVLHSEAYENEAKMLELLILGQRLESGTLRVNKCNLIEI